ncbi:CBS domain-containing protein Ecym_5661 [Eremothecium cymbalariae DBVPG|uniref:CBS domain-containing protein n=1 Tax=Eremothecium cymbalariae (strain CBS 270.75 / DBVPG 7215 / KCTC 17166 / NRRL Y-17582) TaxID=931890 RepID=I6NEA2_ERECY|nr:hypothetical protein Ecym_5661 [Eremothecium cymbalariae DBVPG\
MSGVSGSGALPTVSSLSLDKPLFCREDDSTLFVARLIYAERIHCVLVLSGDRELCGIITTKDIVFRGCTMDERLKARDILTGTPVVGRSNMLVTQALELMIERKIRHLPVRQDSTGRVVGILDITKCFHQALLKLEKFTLSAAKLNNALNDVIDSDTSLDWMRFLKNVSKLIQQMETPNLKTILDSPHYATTPAIAGPSTSVAEALELMRLHDTTAILVRDTEPLSKSSCKVGGTAHISIRKEGVQHDFNIIGIFTSKDVVCRVLQYPENIDLNNCTLARVMTTRPNYALYTLGIHSALRMMYDGHFLNLPVIDERGSIVGLLTVLQLTHAALSCQLSPNIQKSDSPYVNLGEAGKILTKFGNEADVTNPGSNELTDPGNEYKHWNYFWKSFDISENESSLSSASSQLSLIDLKQSLVPLRIVSRAHSNPEMEPRKSLSMTQIRSSRALSFQKRKTSLLRKTFFEKGVLKGYVFKIDVFTVDSSNDSLQFLKRVNIKVKHKRLVKYPSLLDHLLSSFYDILRLNSSDWEYQLFNTIDTTKILVNNNDHLKRLLDKYFKPNKGYTTVPLILKLKKHRNNQEVIFDWLQSKFKILKNFANSSWLKLSFIFFIGVGLGKVM